MIHLQDFYIDGTRQSDGYVSTIKYKCNYVGRVDWYYPNGQLEHYTTYHPESLKKFGPAAWYLENGELLAKGTYEYGSAYDGIVRNYTYAARYTKTNNGQLISRLDYYQNSHQVAREIFYQDDNFRIKEEFFYDKKNEQIGHLIYADEPGFVIQSGTNIEFYRSDNANISIKTISYYKDQKATGEQITYRQDGTIWTKGINKDDKFFDGEFIKGHEYYKITKGKIQLSKQYTDDWELSATLIYKNNKIWEGTRKSVIVNDLYNKGKHTEQITYYSPKKNTIRSRKIFGKDSDVIHWYNKVGVKIGTGRFEGRNIIDGLNIIYRVHNTQFTNYKNGQKEGVEKLFDDRDQLLSEKIYQNGNAIHDKTRNPITGQIVECTYKDGVGFNGRYFEYDNEYIFKDGLLIQKNEYAEQEGQLQLVRSSYYTPNEHPKIITFENGQPTKGNGLD